MYRMKKISDYYNKSRMYLLDLHKEVEKDLLDIIVNGQKKTLFNSKQMHYRNKRWKSRYSYSIWKEINL